MTDIMALATGRTYDLVLATGITAHPVVAPFPKKVLPYVAPIKKGGTVEYVYQVLDVIECLPSQVYEYASRLSPDDYQRLVSYYEQRASTFGFSRAGTKYRFYILRKCVRLPESYERKGIQICVYLDWADVQHKALTRLLEEKST